MRFILFACVFVTTTMSAFAQTPSKQAPPVQQRVDLRREQRQERRELRQAQRQERREQHQAAGAAPCPDCARHSAQGGGHAGGPGGRHHRGPRPIRVEVTEVLPLHACVATNSTQLEDIKKALEEINRKEAAGQVSSADAQTAKQALAERATGVVRGLQSCLFVLRGHDAPPPPPPGPQPGPAPQPIH